MIRVDDVELETKWIGEPSSKALVFLHEGLGSITQWRDTPAAIARATGLPAFLYARQGYGQSSPATVPRPLTYMHDEAARLPQVLSAVGISSPILVGHSDGASIAIIAAGTEVIEASALVLIAPHVFVEDVSVASIARAAEQYRAGELRGRLARHHADVDGAFWGWNRAWLDPAFRAWNLEAYLPRITTATLVLQGDQDEYGTIAQVEAITRQLAAPVEVALIHAAGHAPFRDAPDEVHARISAFVVARASD